MNQYYFIYSIGILVLGLILSAFIPSKQEKMIVGIMKMSILIHFILTIVFTINWILNGTPTIFYEAIQLYKSGDSVFSIDFYFDKFSAFFSIIASIISFVVVSFSRFYLHREKGYRRYFNNMLFFYIGINLIIFAGNLETLFIGWEIIGVASFLSISFFRDRFLPIKNALKVISYYRLADIALLIVIWLCHHAFHRSLTFLELSTQQIFIENAILGLIIPLIFLLSALVKSAQFPFSTWLPRAMEGPTSSSAIFYGSLSVHIGVFLMLRTYPLWAENTIFKVIMISFGIITAFISTNIASVQSTVKTQIAYASITQIGLMFIEVALGWHWLALIHFAGNAFLRSYQLLVSPSVLSYLIHDQFFNFVKPKNQIQNNFIGKIKSTIYILSIKEWNLDSFFYQNLWKPLKKFGEKLYFFDRMNFSFFLFGIFIIGYFLINNHSQIPSKITNILPIIFNIFGLIFILKAFAERKNAQTSWFLVIANQLITALSIYSNDQFEIEQTMVYLSGIVISGLLGYFCLVFLKKNNQTIDLNSFHGYSYKYPKLTFLFLLATLGLSGFPITPTFIGEDILLGNIHQNQFLLVTLTALSLILDGLAIFRIYARLFLGPHLSENHEVAFRSS